MNQSRAVRAVSRQRLVSDDQSMANMSVEMQRTPYRHCDETLEKTVSPIYIVLSNRVCDRDRLFVIM